MKNLSVVVILFLSFISCSENTVSNPSRPKELIGKGLQNDLTLGIRYFNQKLSEANYKIDNRELLIKGFFMEHSSLKEEHLNTVLENSFQFSKEFPSSSQKFALSIERGQNTKNQVETLINKRNDLNDSEKYLFHELNNIFSKNQTLDQMRDELISLQKDVSERNIDTDLLLSYIKMIEFSIKDIKSLSSDIPKPINTSSHVNAGIYTLSDSPFLGGGDGKSPGDGRLDLYRDIDWGKAFRIGLAGGITGGTWFGGAGLISGGTTGLFFGPGGTFLGGLGGTITGSLYGFTQGFYMGFGGSAIYDLINRLEEINEDKRKLER